MFLRHRQGDPTSPILLALVMCMLTYLLKDKVDQHWFFADDAAIYFNDFHIPIGGSLYLESPEGAFETIYQEGPVDYTENNDHKQQHLTATTNNHTNTQTSKHTTKQTNKDRQKEGANERKNDRHT